MLRANHMIGWYPVFKRPILLLRIRKLIYWSKPQTFLAITLSPIGPVSLLPVMTDCRQPCTADSDFSLMADWACHQSHYNLRFDMLQAEPLDSRDSYCHPQSKQWRPSNQLDMKEHWLPVYPHIHTHTQTSAEVGTERKKVREWMWSITVLASRRKGEVVPLSSSPCTESHFEVFSCV